MNQRMRKLAGTLLVMTIVGTIPNSLLADELTTTKDPIVATQDNLMIENDIENEVLETTSVSEQVENELTDARVMNYVDKEDRVIVTGVQQGDVIKVYDIAGNQIGTATIGIGWTKEDGFPVNIGEVAIGDTVGVTLTREGKTESEKLELMVGETPVTDKIKEEQVKVTNTVQGYTTLTLTGLQADTYYDGNNKVNVYDSTGKIIAFKRVSPIDEEVVINISNDSIYEGKIALSYIQDGKIESEKLDLIVGEQVTDKLAVDQVGVSYYSDYLYGNGYKVTVKNLQPNDIVKIYNGSGELIREAKVSTSAHEISRNVGALAEGDKIAITLTQAGKKESEKLELTYGAEVTDKVTADRVKIEYNKSSGYIVRIKGLQNGDIVKIYNEQGDVVRKASMTYGMDYMLLAVGTLPQEGTLSVTVTNPFKAESEKFEIPFETQK